MFFIFLYKINIKNSLKKNILIICVVTPFEITFENKYNLLKNVFQNGKGMLQKTFIEDTTFF